MAETYGPFDAGSGASITEDFWRKFMSKALRTGVIKNDLNALAVTENSPAAMNVLVATGRAWVEGHLYESDAQQTVSISAADPTNPRIDRVVVEADFTNNTMDVLVLTGTPAGSPTAPSLTQTSSKWQISLAQIAVAALATSIVTANITDERSLMTAVGSYASNGLAVMQNATLKGVQPTLNFSNGLSITEDTTNKRFNITSGSGDLQDVQFVRKTADESVTSSTTLQDDNHLFQAIAANEIWTFDLFLLADGPSAGDIKGAFTWPAGATAYWCSFPRFQASDALDTPVAIPTSGSVQIFPLSSVGTKRAFFVSGIINNGANAGTLQFQWAQVVSDGSACTVFANSHLTLRRWA